MLGAIRKGKMKEALVKTLESSYFSMEKREEGKTFSQLNPAKLNQVEHGSARRKSAMFELVLRRICIQSLLLTGI